LSCRSAAGAAGFEPARGVVARSRLTRPSRQPMTCREATFVADSRAPCRGFAIASGRENAVLRRPRPGAQTNDATLPRATSTARPRTHNSGSTLPGPPTQSRPVPTGTGRLSQALTQGLTRPPAAGRSPEPGQRTPSGPQQAARPPSSARAPNTRPRLHHAPEVPAPPTMQTSHRLQESPKQRRSLLWAHQEPLTARCPGGAHDPHERSTSRNGDAPRQPPSGA